MSNFKPPGREIGERNAVAFAIHDVECRATFALVVSELWSVRALVIQVRTSHYSKNEPKISDFFPTLLAGPTNY